ncbi:Prefoldin alpha-like, partial [Dillenia turbinata]
MSHPGSNSRPSETELEELGGKASKGGGMMRVGEMSIEQLKALKEQTDLEVNLLQDSLNNIRTATTRLELASVALHDLSLRPQGKKMLVPLTASLYVPGTLDDADKVLVDVGTGYFIEKTMAEGKDYCDRKINLLKSNYEQLMEYRQYPDLRNHVSVLELE